MPPGRRRSPEADVVRDTMLEAIQSKFGLRLRVLNKRAFRDIFYRERLRERRQGSAIFDSLEFKDGPGDEVFLRKISDA